MSHDPQSVADATLAPYPDLDRPVRLLFAMYSHLIPDTLEVATRMRAWLESEEATVPDLIDACRRMTTVDECAGVERPADFHARLAKHVAAARNTRKSREDAEATAARRLALPPGDETTPEEGRAFVAACLNGVTQPPSFPKGKRIMNRVVNGKIMQELVDADDVPAPPKAGDRKLSGEEVRAMTAKMREKWDREDAEARRRGAG